MRLLTGPAGSGKTARVLAEFREALANGAGRVRLLVPTATLSEHLRNELARDGVLVRSRAVSTLAQWTREIAPEISLVDPVHFHLMVEGAVLRLDRPEFRDVREMPGVHARLARTISDLDSTGCTPEKLARVHALLAPFRDALVAVWIDVERQMEARRVVTRGEQLRKIALQIDRYKLPDQIWMDGFAQLSGPEIELLCALGARTQLTVTLADEGVSEGLKQALLERGFDEQRLTGSHAPEEIFTVPETIDREAEEIARRILGLAGSGTEFRDIGVILRQPAKYEPVLRAAFERFRVPAHFYFGEPLASHAAGRLLSGTLEALLNGWDHEQTLAVLRLAPLAGESNLLDQLEMEMLERLPGRGLAALMGQARGRLLQRLLQRFRQLEEWRGVQLPAGGWAPRLQSLPSLFWPGYLPDGASPGEIEQFRSHAAGLQAFVDAVQKAADWESSAKPLRLADFWRTVQSAIRLTSVTLPNRSRNVVHVISAYEARQWNLSAAFVCGLVEKDFPAQNARDPFLPDGALFDLKKRGIAARTSIDKDAEERTLFEAACARARDLLVLTYPRTDGRGQVTLPSIFLRDRTVNSATIPVRPLLPPPIAQWRQPSRVKSEDLLRQLESRHPKVSVTALESLLQCPFQFFAQRTLRIAEPAHRPEDRLDFLLRGNIVHEVLREWGATRGDPEAIFHRTFDRICAEKNVQPGYRTELQRRLLWAAVRRFVRDPKLPLPLDTELEQSFELAIDGSLNVSGKLDRIDRIGGDRAIVIDYKYSRASSTKDKVEDETRLQGPLYAWAARQVFGVDPVAMLYISLRDDKPGYAGWGEVPGLQLHPTPPGWIEGALDRVAGAVSEFRSGAVHPRPANRKHCGWCAFQDACRVTEPMAIPVSGTLQP